jgi:hypothetical protein
MSAPTYRSAAKSTAATEKSNEKVDQTQLAALVALLNRLRRWETTNKVYMEMCGIADSKHRKAAQVKADELQAAEG